jgi:hypothetical protein
VDVDYPKLGAADVPEAVLHATRGGDEAPGARAEDLLAHLELGLAVEHVERVDVVGMAVKRDALEVGAEPELDHLVLRKLAEDAMVALATRDMLSPLGS